MTNYQHVKLLDKKNFIDWALHDLPIIKFKFDDSERGLPVWMDMEYVPDFKKVEIDAEGKYRCPTCGDEIWESIAKDKLMKCGYCRQELDWKVSFEQ